MRQNPSEIVYPAGVLLIAVVALLLAPVGDSWIAVAAVLGAFVVVEVASRVLGALLRREEPEPAPRRFNLWVDAAAEPGTSNGLSETSPIAPGEARLATAVASAAGAEVVVVNLRGTFEASDANHLCYLAVPSGTSLVIDGGGDPVCDRCLDPVAVTRTNEDGETENLCVEHSLDPRR